MLLKQQESRAKSFDDNPNIAFTEFTKTIVFLF